MWIFWMVAIVVAVYCIGKKQKASKPQLRKSSIPNAATYTPVSTATGTDADTDAWEGAFYDAIGPQRSVNKTVRLDYCDANGKVTNRVVDVYAFESTGSTGLVISRCRLRNARRTFRFDRMRRVVDEETGEIIGDLQKCLNEQWLASPQPVMDKLFSDHHDVLKMMLYMAKADGSVRAAELAVIAKYCVDLTQDERITVAMIKDMLQYVDTVSITTFVRTYNKLHRDRPEAAIKAAAACREIVATQKTIHPNEQAALDALGKPLPARKMVAKID